MDVVTDQNLSHMILMRDFPINHCRFLMTSYLRLRLSKIQSQIWTLGTWSLDTWAFDTELLSKEELTFAKSYRGASICDIH